MRILERAWQVGAPIVASVVRRLGAVGSMFTFKMDCATLNTCVKRKTGT